MPMRDVHMTLPDERVNDFERILELARCSSKVDAVAFAGILTRYICEAIHKAAEDGDKLSLCLIRNRDANQVERIRMEELDRIG